VSVDQWTLNIPQKVLTMCLMRELRRRTSFSKLYWFPAVSGDQRPYEFFRKLILTEEMWLKASRDNVYPLLKNASQLRSKRIPWLESKVFRFCPRHGAPSFHDQNSIFQAIRDFGNGPTLGTVEHGSCPGNNLVMGHLLV